MSLPEEMRKNLGIYNVPAGWDDANEKFNAPGITDDALHVALQSYSFPAQWFVQVDGAVGTNDNDTIYESGDVSMYNYHVIENMSAGAGSCDVFISLDGTNYTGSAAAVELIDDVTTGGGVKVITIPQNKTGILRGKFNKIKVLQDGATAADARIVHGVV